MTDVALKDYLERVIAAEVGRLDQRVLNLSTLIEQQRAYADRAVEKAELAVDKRLTAMNEFRDALKDQAARMATQEQVDRVRDRVVEVEKRMAVIAATYGVLSGIVTSVISAAVLHWMLGK